MTWHHGWPMAAGLYWLWEGDPADRPFLAAVTLAPLAYWVVGDERGRLRRGLPADYALWAWGPLNLPMAKARGFQTPPHGGSRGPFRPRAAACLAPTPGAPEQHFPTRFPRQCPKAHAGQFEVLTEMITYMFQAWPPVRLLRMLSHEGAMHPARLTQPVRQQIKHLILWRSTFYAGDFPLQRPMLSVKELARVYQFICDLCNTFLRPSAAWGIGLAGQHALDPMAEARGLRA